MAYPESTMFYLLYGFQMMERIRTRKKRRTKKKEVQKAEKLKWTENWREGRRK